MSLVDRLLSQLKSRGLSITAGAEPGQLLLHGPDREKTPEILKALKAMKPHLLARYGAREATAGTTPKPEPPAEPEPESESCPLCARDVSDPESRARLADPLYCEFFQNPRCPYKPSP
jgi:hypothetical protein